MNLATSQQSVAARIADRLAQVLGPRRYRMWFDRSARISFLDQDNRLVVTVPNRFVADWIGKNFHQQLQDIAQQELGHHVNLDVQVQQDQFAQPPNSSQGPSTPPQQSIGSHDPAPRTATKLSPPALNTLPSGSSAQAFRHSLDTFVVGPSNELAYAAAVRLVDQSHAGISPLCIHGNCGLGKTHLLQGICSKLLQDKPQARVLYTTGEQFTNDFLAAMRANKLDQFRRRIRQLDLLAVDDIHFIANKQATQQEFLHSFDAIDLSGARVVLASDCHPKLIKQFSEALVSRCVRGMVVQVRPPDVTTRTKIIQALADRRGLKLLDSVAQELANRCVGSVRDIEGALAKLHALAHLSRDRKALAATNSPPSDELDAVGHSLINHLFDASLPTHQPKAISWESILQAVTQHMGINRSQVLGHSRHKHVVLTRSVLIYLTRQLTPLSYPEIASAMGRRTHSTIVTAAQRVEKQLAANQLATMPVTLEQLPLSELVARLKQSILTNP